MESPRLPDPGAGEKACDLPLPRRQVQPFAAERQGRLSHKQLTGTRIFPVTRWRAFRTRLVEIRAEIICQ